MVLTRDFKETIVDRVNHDPDFARALLDEASTLFLNGEPETARMILRDLVNATIGFETLARTVSTPPKSLHRMLSQRGNPSMNSIATIFSAVSKNLNVRFQTSLVEPEKQGKAAAS